MSDTQWKAIAAIVGKCGARTDLRGTIDGIRWVLHSGAKWREMPSKYGKATTAWRWYQRWCSDGTWLRLAVLTPVQAEVAKPGRRPVVTIAI